ncbi:hypothetical protein GEMRC1_013964 [Eukaryota sp. GEM-RC1]
MMLIKQFLIINDSFNDSGEQISHNIHCSSSMESPQFSDIEADPNIEAHVDEQSPEPLTIDTNHSPQVVPLDLNSLDPVTLETSTEHLSSRIRRLAAPRSVAPPRLSKTISPPEKSLDRRSLADKRRELAERKKKRDEEFARKRQEQLEQRQKDMQESLLKQREEAKKQKEDQQKQRRARIKRITSKTERILHKPVDLSWSNTTTSSHDPSKNRREKDTILEQISKENRERKEMREKINATAKRLLSNITSPVMNQNDDMSADFALEDYPAKSERKKMSHETWERLTSPQKSKSKKVNADESPEMKKSPVVLTGLPRVALLASERSGSSPSPRQLIEHKKNEWHSMNMGMKAESLKMGSL